MKVFRISKVPVMFINWDLEVIYSSDCAVKLSEQGQGGEEDKKENTVYLQKNTSKLKESTFSG